jgi:hypothetical protein
MRCDDQWRVKRVPFATQSCGSSVRPVAPHATSRAYSYTETRGMASAGAHAAGNAAHARAVRGTAIAPQRRGTLTLLSGRAGRAERCEFVRAEEGEHARSMAGRSPVLHRGTRDGGERLRPTGDEAPCILEHRSTVGEKPGALGEATLAMIARRCAGDWLGKFPSRLSGRQRELLRVA